MSKTKRALYRLFVVLVLATACKDDEIHIAITGTDVSESYPYCRIKILFDNSSHKRFDVFFNDKPSMLNGNTRQSGSSDGMMAVIPPLFTSEENVEISLKAEGQTFHVQGTFKVKKLPEITYVSSNKCTMSHPIKIVVDEIEYFNQGSVAMEFCRGDVCSSGFRSINGDTIVAGPSIPYGSPEGYALPFTIKVSGNIPLNADVDLGAPQSITGTTNVFFRPTYKLLSSSKLPNETFGVIYYNAKYFADDMTLKFGARVVPAIGIEFAEGGLVGIYRVPDMLPASYDVTVTDPENMEYLPEGSSVFIVQ